MRVETPVHGKMNCTGNTTEHVCYFMCFPGYELTGSKNRTCSAEKVWTGRETACESELNFLLLAFKNETLEFVT